MSLLVALAACGRFGFDPTGGGGGGGGDAPVDTAVAVGPQALVTFAGAIDLQVGGANGEAVAAAGFQGSLAVGGQMFTAQAITSAVVARFTPTGALAASTLLDSTALCESRDLLMVGDSALMVGDSRGTAMAGLGACSINASVEDPVTIAVDATGAAQLDLHFVAGGANAQIWRASQLSDGTFLLGGLYGGDLQIGSTTLPTASFDNAWLARVDASGQPMWTTVMPSATDQTIIGGIAPAGTEACVLAGFYTPTAFLGNALPAPVGGIDDVIARIDANGNPKFVRVIGTTGNESRTNAGLVATPDGGCMVSLDAPGDLTIDGQTFLASDGPSVMLVFDGTGTLNHGFRLPSPIAMTLLQGLYPFGVMNLNAPFDFGVGGGMFSPQGYDVAIVQLDSYGSPYLVGVIGGAGDQLRELVRPIAPIDSLELAVSGTSTGAVSFGSASFDSGAATIFVLATIGVAPP